MGRPNKSLISRKNAARAALAVIDTNGLQALSLELVAQRLSVRAPSLYYHFKNKDELLAEVARTLLKDVEVTNINQDDWEETLVELCRATRRAILKHSNAAPLLLKYFPRKLLLGAYDYWISLCPLPADVQYVILEGTEKLTYGSALFEAAARANGVDPMPQFSAEDFPALAACVTSNPHDDETLFVETVRRFLAGFRVSTEDMRRNPKPVANRVTKRPSPPRPKLVQTDAVPPEENPKKASSAAKDERAPVSSRKKTKQVV